MFKVHKKLGYALIALNYMRAKDDGKRTTAKELAQHYSFPFDAVSRVLQNMMHVKIVESIQGSQGGYRIVKDLQDVSFLDLVESVLGPVNITQCISGNVVSCNCVDSCHVIEPIDRLNNELKDFYRSLSLTTLLDRAHGKSIIETGCLETSATIN
jgi:Rrf2 family transcriptional regulator, nitric oxide-sensitive transcriptional repressor